MKTNSKTIAVMMLVLFMASCNNKDDRMLTVINEDGTCIREYSFHTEEKNLMIPQEEDFDSLIDKHWERTWSVIGNDSVRHPVPMTQAQADSLQNQNPDIQLSDSLMVHVKKRFEMVQDMSDHLLMAEGFKANSKLEKIFKWFYTDYTFTETFVYDGPSIFPIPISRFLGADSASYWFTGHPDLTRNCSGQEKKEVLDKMEVKVNQWINANWFTEICKIIADNYDKVKNPPVDKETFVGQCDELAMHPDVLNYTDDKFDNFKELLDRHFHSDAYTSLKLDTLDNSLPYESFLAFNTNYDLVMPGRVTDAGMGEYDGRVIHYRVSGERTIPDGFKYSIRATSRVTNIWAFIVTFLVIALAIGSFFIRRLGVSQKEK